MSHVPSGLIASVLVGLVVVAVVAGASCRPRAEAGRYEKDGLAFDHLAGWSVTRDKPSENAPGTRSLAIEGPNHAVLTISIFAVGLPISLESFAEAASAARSKAIDQKFTVGGVSVGGESGVQGLAPLERTIAGATAKGLVQHFSTDVLNARVPHTTEFLSVERAGHPVVLMDQAADKHRASVDAGFQKIFDTLSLAP